AHMGLLPRFRGMNVAEWAALIGSPVGCSVYWMSRGIDTGPIILTRDVSIAGCATIDEVRSRVDAAKLDALDEVLRMVLEQRSVPAGRRQQPEDGRQFY